ncbi:uncharacterized protein LOC135462139 [Liolophura sinensis]|uniref:uncharacterized protein LOC135462139 n=1 Tax=Liolophura sinensis TaxID=3198878 RepID=UPI003159875C
MMGGQGNMMGGQGNVMRGQGNVMVGQGNMMVGQGNMMSGLGNMMGGQGNMVDIQGNMMGGQGNMMGGQGNMMGRQGNMTGPGNMMDIQENMMDVKGSLQDVMMAQQGSLMSQRRNAGLQGGNVMSNQEVLMSQGQQLNPQQGSLLGQPGNVTTGQGGMAMKPQHGTGMISMGRGSEGGLLPHPGGLLTSQTGMTSDRPGQRSGLRPTGNRSSENSVQRIIEPGMRLSEYVGPGSKLLGSRSDRHDHRPSQIDSKGAPDRNTSSKLRRSWSPKRRNRYSVDRNIEEKFDGFRTGRRSRFSDLGCDDVSQMKSERGSAYTRNPDFRSRSPNTRSQSPGYRSRSPQDFHSRSPRRGNDRNTGKLSDFSTNQSADWRNRNQVRCGRAKRLDRDESSGHDKPQERERRSRFDESSPDIQSRDRSPAVGQLGGRGRPTEGEDQMYTGRGGSFSTRSRQNMRLTEEEIPDLASIRNQLLDQLQQLETGNLSDTAALADIADKLKKVQQQQKLQQQQQQLQQQKQQQQLQLQGGRYKSDHVDPSYTQGQRFDASIGRSRKGEHRTLFDSETYEDSNIDRHQHFDHSLQEKLRSFSPEPERRQWFDRSETRPRKEREDFQPMAGLTQANMVTFDYGHQKVLGAEFSEMTTRSNRESRWAGLREDQDNTDHDIHVADRGFSGTDLSVMDSEAYGRIDDAYSAKATGLLGDFPGRERSTKRQGVSFSSMEEMRGSSGYTNTEPDRRRGLQGQSQGLIGHSPRLMGQTQGLMDQSLGLMGQSQSLMGHSSRMMHQSQGVISQPALSGKTGNPVPLMSLTPSSSAGGRRGKRGTPKVHTKKVSVANLPPSANWKQITSFFNIHMNNRGLADPGSIRNPVTGVLQSRVNSTAFLVFNSEEEAEKAVSHLNGITYDKHTLRLELAA